LNEVSALELALDLLLVIAGVLAGWVNTLAGGGSLLTVPALMWYGLPVDVANGTSRVAVLVQGATAVYGFFREGKLETGLLLPIAVPSVIGAALGAFLATLIPNEVLTPLVIATLVIMAASMFLSPASFAPPEGAQPIDPRTRPAALAALFLAGFYGGFLQAGVGIVLLFVFARLLKIDLVRGNGLKVAVIFIYSIVVVLIFAARARVSLWSGSLLALGQMVGAILGVRFSVRMGQAAVQKVLFVVIVLVALALLFK
jgi:uncharacterized membrane protein YfcA